MTTKKSILQEKVNNLVETRSQSIQTAFKKVEFDCSSMKDWLVPTDSISYMVNGDVIVNFKDKNHNSGFFKVHDHAIGQIAEVLAEKKLLSEFCSLHIPVSVFEIDTNRMRR